MVTQLRHPVASQGIAGHCLAHEVKKLRHLPFYKLSAEAESEDIPIPESDKAHGIVYLRSW